MSLPLSTSEEELVRVLVSVVVHHAVACTQLPVLCLKGLNNGEVEHGAPQVVAELLPQLDAPVGRVLVENELRSDVTLGAGSCGGNRGEPLLQFVDGLLPKSGPNEGDDGGVEGAGDNQVGHRSFLGEG